jgi:hypothetical protein
VPALGQACDILAVSPLATQPLHSDVAPLPQENLIATLSLSGSVAVAEDVPILVEIE